jgi:hypothetical protein
MHCLAHPILAIILCLGITSCNHKKSIKHQKRVSLELVTRPGEQDSIYLGLMQVTNSSLTNEINSQDTFAFFILPLQSVCPACRRTAIKGIAAYDNRLPIRHYIIISANGGRKTINGFFRSENRKLPTNGNVFLDSTNLAGKLNLYNGKPTIYYVFNKKPYKRVAAVPHTIKKDLKEFFKGY